jgi:hypothetical protein
LNQSIYCKSISIIVLDWFSLLQVIEKKMVCGVLIHHLGMIHHHHETKRTAFGHVVDFKRRYNGSGSGRGSHKRQVSPTTVDVDAPGRYRMKDGFRVCESLQPSVWSSGSSSQASFDSMSADPTPRQNVCQSMFDECIVVGMETEPTGPAVPIAGATIAAAAAAADFVSAPSSLPRSIGGILGERGQASLLISNLLSSWIGGPSHHEPTFTIFNGQSGVPLRDFVGALIELVDYLDCGKETLILCLVYMARVRSEFTCITTENVYRLLLAGTLAAVKFHDDLGISNKQYARLIGLELTDVRNLEASLLKILQFSLFVPDSEFSNIASELQASSVPQPAMG